MRILLVDDHDADNYFHRVVILDHASSAHVTVTRDARAALAILLGERDHELPHAVLLDLQMPDLGGWEFLEECRALPESTRDCVRFFVLSGSVDVRERARAEAHELVEAYFVKPLGTTAVEQVFGRRSG